MINNIPIIVFDFETLGTNVKVHEPIQVAALALHPRKLTPYEDGRFSSMMRPPGKVEDWVIDKRALEVNKKTIPEIDAAPAQEVVWKQFVQFCNRFNSQNSVYTLPIAAGQNIVNFDIPIANRLCLKYKCIDKDGAPKLFNRMDVIDLYHITFMWFENTVEPEKRKLDVLREFFGITKEGAHDAMIDVSQTADIILRFLQLHRRLAVSIPFKGAFAKEITK